MDRQGWLGPRGFLTELCDCFWSFGVDLGLGLDLFWTNILFGLRVLHPLVFGFCFICFRVLSLYFQKV